MYPYLMVIIRDFIYYINKNYFKIIKMHQKKKNLGFFNLFFWKKIIIAFFLYNFHLRWYYIFRYLQYNVTIPLHLTNTMSIVNHSISVCLSIPYQKSNIIKSFLKGHIAGFFSILTLPIFGLYCIYKLLLEGQNLVSIGPLFIGFFFGQILFTLFFSITYLFGFSSIFLLFSILLERINIIYTPCILIFFIYQIAKNILYTLYIEEYIWNKSFYIDAVHRGASSFVPFREYLYSLQCHFLNKKTYKNISFYVGLSFAFFEQPRFFPYLSNIVPSLAPTLLEFFMENSFFALLGYFCSLPLGIFIISYSILFVRTVLIDQSTELFVVGIKGRLLTYIIYISFIALTVFSILFYPFEYIFLGPLGFVSKDNAFYGSDLDPYASIDTRAKMRRFMKDREAFPAKFAIFDRGRYLFHPSRIDNLKSVAIEYIKYKPEMQIMTDLVTAGDIHDWFVTLYRIFMNIGYNYMRRAIFFKKKTINSINKDNIDKNKLLTNFAYSGKSIDHTKKLQVGQNVLKSLETENVPVPEKKIEKKKSFLFWNQKQKSNRDQKKKKIEFLLFQKIRKKIRRRNQYLFRPIRNLHPKKLALFKKNFKNNPLKKMNMKLNRNNRFISSKKKKKRNFNIFQKIKNLKLHTKKDPWIRYKNRKKIRRRRNLYAYYKPKTLAIAMKQTNLVEPWFGKREDQEIWFYFRHYFMDPIYLGYNYNKNLNVEKKNLSRFCNWYIMPFNLTAHRYTDTLKFDILLTPNVRNPYKEKAQLSSIPKTEYYHLTNSFAEKNRSKILIHSRILNEVEKDFDLEKITAEQIVRHFDKKKRKTIQIVGRRLKKTIKQRKKRNIKRIKQKKRKIKQIELKIKKKPNYKKTYYVSKLEKEFKFINLLYKVKVLQNNFLKRLHKIKIKNIQYQNQLKNTDQVLHVNKRILKNYNKLHPQHKINEKIQYFFENMKHPFIREKKGFRFTKTLPNENYNENLLPHFTHEDVKIARRRARREGLDEFFNTTALATPKLKVMLILRKKIIPRRLSYYLQAKYKKYLRKFRSSFLPKLSPNQEQDLHYKKLYYLQFLNSLRKYNFNIKKDLAPNNIYKLVLFKNMCKSFSNKFYNHQFKGTLGHVRFTHPINQSKYYQFPSQKLPFLKGPFFSILKYDTLHYTDDTEIQFHTELYDLSGNLSNKIINKDVMDYKGVLFAKNTDFMLKNNLLHLKQDKEDQIISTLKEKKSQFVFDMKITPFFEKIDIHPLSLQQISVLQTKNRQNAIKRYFLTQKELNIKQMIKKIKSYRAWPLTSDKIENFYAAFQGGFYSKMKFFGLVDQTNIRKLLRWEPATLQLSCQNICTDLYRYSKATPNSMKARWIVPFDFMNTYSKNLRIFFASTPLFVRKTIYKLRLAYLKERSTKLNINLYRPLPVPKGSKFKAIKPYRPKGPLKAKPFDMKLNNIKTHIRRANKSEENILRYLYRRAAMRRFVPTYIQNLPIYHMYDETVSRLRFPAGFHKMPVLSNRKAQYLQNTSSRYYENKPTLGGFYWIGNDLKYRMNIDLRNFCIKIISGIVPYFRRIFVIWIYQFRPRLETYFSFFVFIRKHFSKFKIIQTEKRYYKKINKFVVIKRILPSSFKTKKNAQFYIAHQKKKIKYKNSQFKYNIIRYVNFKRKTTSIRNVQFLKEVQSTKDEILNYIYILPKRQKHVHFNHFLKIKN